MPKITSDQTIKRTARKEIMATIPAMSLEAQKGNAQAFKMLLQAGGLSDGGGIKINNVVGVDSRRMGDTQADWKFFQKFRGKIETSVLRKELPPPDEGEDPRAEAIPVAETKEEPTP